MKQKIENNKANALRRAIKPIKLQADFSGEVGRQE